jgi:hypothetical protein
MAKRSASTGASGLVPYPETIPVEVAAILAGWIRTREKPDIPALVQAAYTVQGYVLGQMVGHPGAQHAPAPRGPAVPAAELANRLEAHAAAQAGAEPPAEGAEAAPQAAPQAALPPLPLKMLLRWALKALEEALG